MHFRVGGTAADTVLFEDNSLGTSRSTIGDVIIDCKCYTNMFVIE